MASTLGEVEDVAPGGSLSVGGRIPAGEKARFWFTGISKGKAGHSVQGCETRDQSGDLVTA